METKVINIYEYKELEPKAKERALNKYREHQEFYWLDEDITQFVEEKLREYGITPDVNFKVYYSLSYCQGDGLMFEGTFDWKGLRVKIMHAGRYYHYNSKNIIIYSEDGEEIDGSSEYSLFEGIYKDICGAGEKYGYEQIDYLTSEKYIESEFVEREYRFRSDGSVEEVRS